MRSRLRSSMVFLLFFVVLCPFLPALEEVHYFDVDVKKESAEVKQYRVILNTPTQSTVSTDPYRFILQDAEGSDMGVVDFDMYWFVLGDPPLAVDVLHLKVAFPFHEDAQFLVIVHDGKELLKYEIPPACVVDGVCGGYETHFGCPDDCASYAADSVCVPVLDSGCDPDCNPSSDPDCRAYSDKVKEVLAKDEKGLVDKSVENDTDESYLFFEGEGSSDGVISGGDLSGGDTFPVQKLLLIAGLVLFLLIMIVVISKIAGRGRFRKDIPP